MITFDSASKIYSNQSDIEATLHRLRFQNKKIVFTNGCFDILHVGHVEYLEDARKTGDFLIVGVNTDDSVKRLKGESRPVNEAYARARVLAALYFVDAILFFDQDTPLELITFVQPDILVKGADYQISTIVGADFVLSKGGQVLTIPLREGYSTTGIIGKVKDK